MKSPLFKYLSVALAVLIVIAGGRVVHTIYRQAKAIETYQSLYETTLSDKRTLENAQRTTVEFFDEKQKDYQTEIDTLKSEVERLDKLLTLERAEGEKRKDKVIYLTFDDGPSDKVTPELLDLLDYYDIKATFFVTGYQVKKNPDILKDIVNRGHAVGNHSATHDYYKIYQNLDTFKEDFETNQELIFNAVGFYPTLYRFPGGVLTAHNIAGKEIKQTYETYLWDQGVQYFDWNVDSRDASVNLPSVTTIRSNLLYQLRNKKKAIILMHDTNSKGNTVKALGPVIETYLEKGYRFDKLTADGFTVQHQR
ncbi:polysaccharide deacetylase family protein [Fusibacter sp. JL298sf-3]